MARRARAAWRRELDGARIVVDRAELALQAQPEGGWRYPIGKVELVNAPAGAEGPRLRETLDTAGRRVLNAPLRGCLDALLRAADKPPEAMLALAQRWGLLGLCAAHGKPVNHDARCTQPVIDGVTVWEPVSGWYRYARQARAILLLAAAVHAAHGADDPDKRYVAPHTWDALWKDTVPEGGERDRDWPVHPGRELGRQRGAVAACASTWLRYGGVVPRLVWWPDVGRTVPTRQAALSDLIAGVKARQANRAAGAARPVSPPAHSPSPVPRPSFPHVALDLLGEGGLFGALAVELAAAICSPIGVYRCHGCANPYTPRRRHPRRGAAHYCPACAADADLAAKRRSWHAHKAVWASARRRRINT